jgi:hypothetical protein
MANQMIGLIEFDGELSDFDWPQMAATTCRHRFKRQVDIGVATEHIDAEASVLKAELDREYTRLSRRIRAE